MGFWLTAKYLADVDVLLVHSSSRTLVGSAPVNRFRMSLVEARGGISRTSFLFFIVDYSDRMVLDTLNLLLACCSG